MITVLRLGHRVVRDQRLTTHVALTARAFGADGIVISGEKDEGIIRVIKRVCEEFGGNFDARFIESWRGFVKEWREKNRTGIIVHLTMYGVDIDDERCGEMLRKIKEGADVLVVVGGPKVEGQMYQIADYNIAAGNQPHSEVAALALFLDRAIERKKLKGKFENGRIRIISNPRGKTIVQNKTKDQTE